MKRIALFSLTLLFTVCSHAVTLQKRGIPNPELFGIEFGNTGYSYYGSVNGVRSISMHTYITGTFRVNELNITSDSASGLVRIYHVETLSADELARIMNDAQTASGVPGKMPTPQTLPGVQAMADRAKTVADVVTSDVVIKDYPVATHAHTIEFRLSSLSELVELYEKLTDRWMKKPDPSEEGEEEDPKKISLARALFKVDV